MSTLTFYPWMRRGLAKHLDNASTPPAQAGLEPYLSVNQIAIGPMPAVLVRGPGAVVALSDAAIRRVEPQPGTQAYETNYFAHIEFSAGDLPWAFTPSGPDASSRLPPWLVLVVVRRQPGVALIDLPGAKLPVLRIEPPADPRVELIDLGEAWAWAHTQAELHQPDGSTINVDSAMESGPGRVISRLVCPRELEPDSEWIACVVPAYDAGRLAGLGQEFANSTLSLAWDLTGLDGTRFDLPVYYSWRFATGADGDFRSLAMRLEPTSEPAGLGLHAMDVGTPGGPIPDSPGPVLVDYVGALKAPGPVQTWGTTERDAFEDEMLDWWDGTNGRLVLTEMPNDEPEIKPPMYGSWQRGWKSLPAPNGWARDLNLDPVHRSVAGLGAEVVRRNQESLMAAAWDQVGELRRALSEYNRTLLRAEVGNALARRVSGLDDALVAQATASIHTFLPASSGTGQLSEQVSSSLVPDGLLSPAFTGRLRPGTAAGRAWQSRPATSQPAIQQATNQFIAATASGSGSSVLSFGVMGVPSGTVLDATPASTVQPVGPDISQVATTVRQELRPTRFARASLDARIPELTSGLPADKLPSKLAIGSQVGEPIGPVFEDPLIWDLAELDPEWILPGAKAVPEDSVRLLEVNEAFVPAFLAGANHEMNNELFWREFPFQPAATSMHRFWQGMGGASRDIDSMHTWSEGATLDSLMTGEGSGAVAVLIRGEIVRRYPALIVYLGKATLDQVAKKVTGITERVKPAFYGRLTDDMCFYGFDKPLSEITADYWFVLEEPATAPRFGLDADNPQWPALTQTSAHVATDTFRVPFRVVRRASTLL